MPFAIGNLAVLPPLVDNQLRRPMSYNVQSLFEDGELDHLHALARQLQSTGADILHCSMINPDLPPPRLLLDKLVEGSMKPLNHRYTVSRGVGRLRQAFAERYQRIFGVQFDCERECCVTLGAKDAVLCFLRALVESGKIDRGSAVLLPSPCYPAHRAAALLAGLVPNYLSLDPRASDDEIVASWVAAFRTRKSHVAILNFPHNPTGRVLSAEQLTRLVEAAQESGHYVLNDFAYGELCFEPTPAPSILRSVSRGFPGSRLVEVYTMSKIWSVPGWRVAALCGDPELVRMVAKLKSWSDYGQFLPVQTAAAAALESRSDLPADARLVYRRRTEVLARGLAAAGWGIPRVPQAGVSVWAQAPARFASDGVTAAERLLRSSFVMATPGVAFGEGFSDWVRFAAVLPEERLRDLLSRLGEDTSVGAHQ